MNGIKLNTFAFWVFKRKACVVCASVSRTAGDVPLAVFFVAPSRGWDLSDSNLLNPFTKKIHSHSFSESSSDLFAGCNELKRLIKNTESFMTFYFTVILTHSFVKVHSVR